MSNVIGKMNSLRVAMAIVETASSEIQILMGKGLVRIQKSPLKDGSESYFVRLPERPEQIPYGRLLLLQIEVGLGLELVLKILIKDAGVVSLVVVMRDKSVSRLLQIRRCFGTNTSQT